MDCSGSCEDCLLGQETCQSEPDFMSGGPFGGRSSIIEALLHARDGGNNRGSESPGLGVNLNEATLRGMPRDIRDAFRSGKSAVVRPKSGPHMVLETRVPALEHQIDLLSKVIQTETLLKEGFTEQNADLQKKLGSALEQVSDLGVEVAELSMAKDQVDERIKELKEELSALQPIIVFAERLRVGVEDINISKKAKRKDIVAQIEKIQATIADFVESGAELQ